jgi:hypothetical protein
MTSSDLHQWRSRGRIDGGTFIVETTSESHERSGTNAFRQLQVSAALARRARAHRTTLAGWIEHDGV